MLQFKCITLRICEWKGRAWVHWRDTSSFVHFHSSDNRFFFIAMTNRCVNLKKIIIIVAFKIQQTIIARLSMTFLRKCAQKGCSWTTADLTIIRPSLLCNLAYFFGKYRFYCKTINTNHSNVIRFTHLYLKLRMHPSNQAHNSPLGSYCSKRIRFPFVEKQLLP